MSLSDVLREHERMPKLKIAVHKFASLLVLMHVGLESMWLTSPWMLSLRIFHGVFKLDRRIALWNLELSTKSFFGPLGIR
jgi:hypothetical protein